MELALYCKYIKENNVRKCRTGYEKNTSQPGIEPTPNWNGIHRLAQIRARTLDHCATQLHKEMKHWNAGLSFCTMCEQIQFEEAVVNL